MEDNVAQTDGYNADIADEQIRKLKDIFPEVFSENKIDWEKLRVTLGNDADLGERYGLSWKGKSDVFAKIQEKTPNTLHPQKDESVDWDTTQNMFIEGDNLEALKVLHKAYYGKVKMIYIDPPYNTGNDFVYNDDFKQTRASYDQEVGITDDEGNVTRDDGLRANTGGHKHSNWLNMMYPRLFLARNLLRQDGVIFVSIDDNEVHNLRLMMNEIFGEGNFVAQIIWERAYAPKNDAKYISNSHDYVLMFTRNINEFQIGRLDRTEEANARYSNPDNDSRGVWKSSDMSVKTYSESYDYPITTPSGRVVEPPASRSWRLSEKSFSERLADNRIWFGADGKSVPSIKRFLHELKFDGMAPTSILFYKDVGHSQEGAKEVVSLFDGKGYFDGPKPVRLMNRLMKIAGTREDDIIMDFFGGSGTIAQAVYEMNVNNNSACKWLMVQLPELTSEQSDAYKGGYKTIADISRERIRRAGAKISKDFSDKIAERDTPLDLGFRPYQLDNSNFKKWNELVTDPDEIRNQAELQLDPLEDGTKDVDLLTEILLKRGISPLVEIKTNDDFYFVPSEKLAISFTRNMTEELFTQILTKSPTQVILLDQAFLGDVNLKTNLILQAEKQNISVETI